MNIQQLFEQRKRPCVYIILRARFAEIYDNHDEVDLDDNEMEDMESYEEFEDKLYDEYEVHDDYVSGDMNKALTEFTNLFPWDGGYNVPANKKRIEKFKRFARFSKAIWVVASSVDSVEDEDGELLDDYNGAIIAVLRK